MPHFILVDCSDAKQKGQTTLNAAFQRILASQGERLIGFPGGNMTLPTYSNGDGQIWYAYYKESDSPIERYWNGFGIFSSGKLAQTISVELNIPTNTNCQTVAGYFAKDSDTGRTYLMHSGKIGGGRPGVGKSAFLAWSKLPRVPVINSTGDERYGIVVGSLDDDSIAATVDRFVRIVAEFKIQAASGALNKPEFQRQVEEFEKFNPEFGGRKKGRMAGQIDYVSAHGYVVNALYKKRLAEKRPGETVFNTPMIDLAVKLGGRTIEIYEVKTSADRQSMYSAVGQLIVHSDGAEPARRILVLPVGHEVPSDIEDAFSRLQIELRRFALGRGVEVLFPAG